MSQLIGQESPPYRVSPLQVADRVESTLAVEYATATVAPQSGRRQDGIAPVHVPSGLHVLVTKEPAITAPSTCNRKLASQLSEHESPTFPSHRPDALPSSSVRLPQFCEHCGSPTQFPSAPQVSVAEPLER